MTPEGAAKLKTRRYNMLYETGMYLSRAESLKERDLARALDLKRRREEKAIKIKKLIFDFKHLFSKNESLLFVMEEIFSTWEKYRFDKDIPNALIQMENCMRNGNFSEELKVWKEWVENNW